MSKCKKRTIVLCLIVFVGVINIVVLNTFSLLSKLSYLININNDFLYIDDNIDSSNITKVYEIVSKPETNIQCQFSQLPKAICSKKILELDLLDNETIAKEIKTCPILKERFANLIRSLAMLSTVSLY